ncbi:MAG TPA: haloacid dehalogenase, partial [Bacteroidales bacterium]|nr:haloacid dehalogenase [Bacteroidales bacterium]
MQLIIFDLDGTLIDSKYDLANALKITALSLNYPYISANEIPALLGDGAGILVAKAFGL